MAKELDGSSTPELGTTESNAAGVASKMLDESVFSYIDGFGGRKSDGYISKAELLSVTTSNDPAVKDWVSKNFGSKEPLEKLAAHVGEINYYAIDWGNPFAEAGASKKDFQELKQRSEGMDKELKLAESIFPTIKAQYQRIGGYSSEITESRLRSASYDKSFSEHDREVFRYILDNRHRLMESSRSGLQTDNVLKRYDFKGEAPETGRLKWYKDYLQEKYSVVKDLNR